MSAQVINLTGSYDPYTTRCDDWQRGLWSVVIKAPNGDNTGPVLKSGLTHDAAISLCCAMNQDAEEECERWMLDG